MNRNRNDRRRRAMEHVKSRLSRWQKAKTVEDVAEILGYEVTEVPSKNLDKVIAAKVETAKQELANLEDKVL